MFNLVLFSVLGMANAENPERALRPTTHPADLALTDGAVENFQRLYCDPATVASQLKPTTAAEGTGHLYIRNNYTAWVDVSIGDIKIGRLQPLTVAVLHDLPAGSYDVAISVEKMQYVDTLSIATVTEAPIPAPGNAKATIALEPDYLKPGLEDNRVYPTGKLVKYQLPTAVAE